MEIRNLTHGYGEKIILHNFSCSIPDGSCTAIMAPSGAGKTTLLRLILGLECPQQGSITGIPAKKSAIFQEDRLIPKLSALANLQMIGCSKSDSIAILTDLGLADSLSKPVSTLSGGMARRVALARALLFDSSLLALDEPFTGLDADTRAAAAAVIRKYRKGRTLLLITHQAEDLQLLGIERCLTLD